MQEAMEIVLEATELTGEVYRFTDEFPDEEKYLMIPVLRDNVLTILENTFLGISKTDISGKLQLLSKAVLSLNELNNRFILCKTVGLVTSTQHNSIHEKTGRLRKLLLYVMNEFKKRTSDNLVEEATAQNLSEQTPSV
jgi:four helix bundle protein